MPASSAQSLFATLPGRWILRREIQDARFGAGTLEGGAIFAPLPNGALLYEERGEFQLGAWRGPAWRRWVYALEGDTLAVRYPGTLAELHLFQCASDQPARHTHICGADRYDAELTSAADGSLSLLHTVTGPSKNYRLRTVLTRG